MKIHKSAIQPPVGERRRWLALVVVCFGQLMIVLDSTIVNVALPSIQRDLHFSQADLTWVVNSYLITYGSLLLLAGRAGDLFGRKRVFLAGAAAVRQRVDVAGSVLVTAAMVLGVYAIVTAAQYGWASAHTLGFGGAAVGLLATFLALEARIENPILPLRILRLRSLTGASAARAMLATGMFATFFMGALYLQHVEGYNSLGTGLAFLPSTLTLGVLSTGITARLMRTFGPRALLIPGLATIPIALALRATADANTASFPGIFRGDFHSGPGRGMSF